MAARMNAVIVDAEVATMAGVDRIPLQRDDAAYGLIHDAAIAVANGTVAWVGPRGDLPPEWRSAEPYSAGGRLVTPGLVECHAHLIFTGDRRDEFAARCGTRGGTAVGDDGSGIRATAEATARCGDEELLDAALRRAWWFIRHGVTSLEIKAGFGLEPDEQLRQLALARRLRDALPVTTRVTLLAGHTYPAGTEDTEEYILRVCDELLPAAIEQGGFDFVEVYCEEEAGLSMEDASNILETVYRRKIPTRVSADHLSDSAGGALAPAFYSKTAAYLNFTDDIAVKAMGNAGTIAVLVPGSALELHQQAPPVDLLRQNRVPIAISTGFEPGTSPIPDLRVAAHLGCALFGLTLPEVLHGITSVAGRAIAVDGEAAGRLVAEGPADLSFWDAEHPEEIVYWASAATCHEVWSGGRRVETPADLP